MRKLLLGVCVAAACWMNDAGAMYAETMDDRKQVFIAKCESSNKRSLMVNRYELGNVRPKDTIRYLHVDYRNMKWKLDQSRELTQEMKDMFYSLPTFIGDFSNLRVLSIHAYSTDNVMENRDKVCLKVLPDSVGNLKNLRILDLSDNNLETLPNSIGDLTNLEELYLSSNYRFSKLPGSIGNLKNLEVLDLRRTYLEGLPESIENLTNLKDISFSKTDNVAGPHTSGVCRDTERVYAEKDYSPNWYRNVVNRSLEHWSCPTLDFDSNVGALSLLSLRGQSLKQIPFGVYMLSGITYKEDENNYYGYRSVYNAQTLYATPALKELDISNNQLTEIPRWLKRLGCLEKLYVHNNPNLNHLPDFLWSIWNLRELKIDGKLIRDLPKNAEYTLDNENLEDSVLDLTLNGKNNKKMNDKELSKITGPYIVHLKK